MSSVGSVTHWIGQLKAGERAAVQHLWEGYFQRLLALARSRLRGAPRRAADEEDVALSAFDSFCRGAEQGRFPRLLDRHDLWPLLVVLTTRKACRLVQHERRQKRGSGKMQGEALLDTDTEAAGPVLAQVIGREPTPEFAAGLAEEFRLLLDRLEGAELRSLALWKMEGFTNDEIAEKLGCVARTVERKLRVIRGLWEQEPLP
jgi:DNA-directed RNA polymerase specialized sigma24 family protein